MEINLIDPSVIVNESTSESQPVCKCLPGCSELSYRSAVSSTKLGTNFHIPKEYMGNFTNETYFKKNMAIVHLFFTESQFTSQLKRELYGFTDFLSSTGGLLGLFLGFSFMSLAEVFYYLTLHLWCTIVRNNLNHHKDSSNEGANTKGAVITPYPFTQ